MSAPLSHGSICLAALCVPLSLPLRQPAVRAQDPEPANPAPLPVEIEAFPSEMERDGSFTLRLELRPTAARPRPEVLRVGLDLWEDELAVHEVDLDVDPTEWRPGAVLFRSVPLAIDEGVPLDAGDRIPVLLSLRDETGTVRAPANGELDGDGWSVVGEVAVAAFRGERGARRLATALAEVEALRKAGEAGEAWRRLAALYREAEDDGTKAGILAAARKVVRLDPPAPSEQERRILDARLRAEKVRYWRQIAGRAFDRGKLFTALLLLEAAGGTLAEGADEAVLGELDEAERAARDIDDVRERILNERSAAEERKVRGLIEQHGLSQSLLTEAEQLVENGEFAVGLELLRQLRRSDDDEVEARAWERIPLVEERFLDSPPPEQVEEARAAIEHPAWERTEVVPTHAFLLIGPRKLVRGIRADSWRNLDLAYLLVTDLFGRIPNPEGDRLTVYFKELWEFGGGVGGGKVIDVGRADPDPEEAVRVDTGLFYHELTHCVDDTLPVLGGFHEGLANLGAVYAHEGLGQAADAQHSFAGNLEAFRRDFLERDLEYWRIQNYGPSAGFFLSFVERYSERDREHDWRPLRRFFRDYREAPVRDGREAYAIRAIAHYLRRAFGPRAFDDLVEYGFPLREEDRRALSMEVAAFENGELDRFMEAYEEFPGSPLPRDLVARQLVLRGLRHGEQAERARRQLGIIDEWKTIGPFFARAADPGAVVFAPEREIDFEHSVLSLRATRDDDTTLEWRDPEPRNRATDRGDVVRLPSGWLRFDYQPYGQRDAAIYAVSSLTLDEETDGWLHVRADDEVTLFLGGERVGTYEGVGRNGSSHLGWRGPDVPLPDAMRFFVHLPAGRTKLLAKIRNRSGPAGLTVALSRSDGSPLAFTADAGLPAPDPALPPPPRWKRVTRIDHRSLRSKTDFAVGAFRAARKAFAGTSTEGEVGWRRFTVRPGFPKDSPSNLLWLKSRLTDGLSDLRLRLEIVAEQRPPKLLVTLQGEGGADGLSGWNLIVVPYGADRAMLRLERYDRLVAATDPLPLGAAEKDSRTLEIELVGTRLTVRLAGEVWFDHVPIRPISNRHRIGLATWGATPAIRSLELFRAQR